MSEKHQDADQDSVDAVGKVTEALEITEQARGHLYAFHQLTGSADLALGGAAELLAKAGHRDWAERLSTELVGLNVLPEHWTYQIVEDYDDGYYKTFHDLAGELRSDLTGGRRHLHEERMKQDRRTPGRPGHEQGPPSTAPPRPSR